MLRKIIRKAENFNILECATEKFLTSLRWNYSSEITRRPKAMRRNSPSFLTNWW